MSKFLPRAGLRLAIDRNALRDHELRIGGPDAETRRLLVGEQDWQAWSRDDVPWGRGEDGPRSDVGDTFRSRSIVHA